MEVRAVPNEVQGFLSALSATGETFAYLATLEERVWVVDRDPEPATLEGLRDHRGRTRKELVALGHLFGEVQAYCPVDMRSYFDWLLCRSHDAAVDPPCTALQGPINRIHECRSISALFTQLAEDPIEQLKSPPKQYGDFLLKRIEEYNAKQSEWPTRRESNVGYVAYTDRRPVYYSLPIPDPELEREVTRILVEVGDVSCDDQPNTEIVPNKRSQNASNRGERASQPARTPSKKRGRPKSSPSSSEEGDLALARNWESARACGNSRKEFARSREMKLSELNRTLDRVRKRRSKEGDSETNTQS